LKNAIEALKKDYEKQTKKVSKMAILTELKDMELRNMKLDMKKLELENLALKTLIKRLGDLAEPEVSVMGPEEELTEPEVSVVERDDDLTEPEEDLAEPEEDLAEPEEDLAEPEEDLAEPEVSVLELEECLIEPEEPVVEPEEEAPSIISESFTDSGRAGDLPDTDKHRSDDSGVLLYAPLDKVTHNKSDLSESFLVSNDAVITNCSDLGTSGGGGESFCLLMFTILMVFCQ
jgi:hypothetical protein